MTSRRSFLLGIGALVSASFVTRVKAHVFERVSCIRMGIAVWLGQFLA
jgi:hypothetical protein